MKKIIFIALFNCTLLTIHAQRALDSITPKQLNFYIQLVKQLNHKWGLDSSKLSDTVRASFPKIPNTSLVNICYDSRSFTIDDEGRKRFNMTSHGGGPLCLTYDTIQHTIKLGGSSIMSSTEQTAYYQNNILKLEIFRISWTDGESYLEIYDKDTMVFKSIDTSALLLFPHPLKRDKLIAVLANKAPIKVKAFKVLIRSGSGRNKRYLLNVIPDSTSKFYYKPGNYFVSINKDQLRKLEKGKDDFFMELYSPLSRLGQIQYCDYESYYTATSIYTIPKYDIIDTVLSYKRGWIPALACKRYIKINSSGFINNKSRHFVKKLIKSGKLNCPSFEERSRFGYITEEEKTKTYEDLFRDDFILYLNKNKLLTP